MAFVQTDNDAVMDGSAGEAVPGRLPMRKGIADPVFAWMRQVCGLHTGTVRQADGNAAGRMAPKAASFGTQGYPWIYLQEMAGFVCLE